MPACAKVETGADATGAILRTRWSPDMPATAPDPHRHGARADEQRADDEGEERQRPRVYRVHVSGSQQPEQPRPGDRPHGQRDDRRPHGPGIVTDPWTAVGHAVPAPE